MEYIQYFGIYCFCNLQSEYGGSSLEECGADCDDGDDGDDHENMNLPLQQAALDTLKEV